MSTLTAKTVRFQHAWGELWHKNTLPRLLKVGHFLGAQVVIQAIGFACGLLIVRSLSKEEYGIFTLASSFQSSMMAVADGGIPVAVTAVGGRVWQDRDQLGGVLNAAMKLRKRMGWVGALVGLPVLAGLLVHNGASTGYTALICTVVLGLYSLNLTSGLLAILPRLHARLRQLQRLEVTATMTRFGALIAASAVGLNAFWALASIGLLVFVQYFGYRNWRREFANPSASPRPDLKVEVERIYRTALPQALFFSVYSQAGIWFLSLFGRVSNIADLGALGRLGAISLVWDAIQRSVFVPHFAKASFQSNLGRKYLGLLLLSSIPTLTLMLIIMIAPDAVLWILGPHYAHLKKEIVVTGLFLVIVGLQGSTQTLNLARGWVVPGWMTVGCGLFLPILSTRLLNLSTVSGVLTMNICLSLAGFVQNVGLAIRRVSATPTVSVERIPVDQEL